MRIYTCDWGDGCEAFGVAGGRIVRSSFVPYRVGPWGGHEVGRKRSLKRFAKRIARSNVAKGVRNLAELTPQGRAAFGVLDAFRGRRGGRGRGITPPPRLNLSDAQRISLVRRFLGMRRLGSASKIRAIEAVVA